MPIFSRFRDITNDLLVESLPTPVSFEALAMGVPLHPIEIYFIPVKGT